ncbi:MAG: ATP-binding protein [Polyangiaceae bacterium]|nr:ATP-binding protein [Polyangiaceae bacterium]
MRLTFKLVLTLWLGFCVLLLLNTMHRVRREAELFERDMQQDHALLGRALAPAVTDAWRAEGDEGARRVLERAFDAERELSARWQPPSANQARPTPPQNADEGRAAPIAFDIVVDAQGGRRLVTYIPVPLGLEQAGVVEVSEPLAAEYIYIRTTLRNTLLLTTATAVFACFAALAVGRWLLGRPLNTLAEHARRFGQGDRTARLHLERRDELGVLARELDTMWDRLEAAHSRLATETGARLEALEQLRHSDRLATVGRLASGLAHELGTPLNVVLGRATLIVREAAVSEATLKGATIIIEQTQRMATLVRQLLDFARQRGPQTCRLDLRSAVTHAIALLAPLTKKAGIELATGPRFDETYTIADPAQLQQVLSNLVVNAVQATPAGGRVLVNVSAERARPPADVGGDESVYARLDVVDNGTGITPEDLKHIFEPFFTTKGIGEGTGLGLSVTYGIVREHGGWIDVESRPGAGSRFSVFLRGAT